MKKSIFKHTFVNISILILLTVLVCPGVLSAEEKDENDEIEWNFDKDMQGSVPAGWKVAETGGMKKTNTMATWEVVADSSAPSKSQVVVITKNKNFGNTFNLLLAEKTSFKDVEVEVKVKALSGKEDQGGGPIWRAKDTDNYYICRWNPLEDNLRVYFVKNGKRKQIGSAELKTDSTTWHEIKIRHNGTKITVKFDSKELLVIEDDTFQAAGMVGLWTKADAATAFDSFEVEAEDN